MSRSPRRSTGSHFSGRPLDLGPIDSRRARPLREGCGSRRPARCVLLDAFRPLDLLLVETCTLITLMRGRFDDALWCRRGVSRGRGVFVLSYSPGASRCPLLGWTSRGDIGELVSPAAPIRRIWRWWMDEEYPPAAPRCAECLGGQGRSCLLHIHTANLCTI